MTHQSPSKITEVALLILFTLLSVCVTWLAVLGPPSLWPVAQ